MSRTVIIGGGAIGLSVAYHLGKRGISDVILLERNKLTSGTSWHAAGIIGPLRATPNMTRLASHALTLFPQLEEETGMSTGYRRTGGYWLAREQARLDELRRICDLGRTMGFSPKMIEQDEIAVPGLAKDGLVAALQVPEDGRVNPVDLCMAYARAAKSLGVEIKEGVSVASPRKKNDRVSGVILADGRVIEADRVVICAGAWSRELAAEAEIALPLQAVEHMYVVTEPLDDLPDPFPVIRDLDRGLYIKGDAGKLVIGGFEPDAKCWDAYGPEGDRAFLELPEDWEQFGPFMQAALELFPALERTGIQHFMNGPESFTFDSKPLIGETPWLDGLYVAAGMNSVGVMSSAGIGSALADWIVDGHPPFDLWEVDIARVDPKTAGPEHLAARMQEAVADVFDLHWPYKQPKAGRGLRKSALHQCWADAGAVFGVTAGWERGLWYAQDKSERDLPYSTGAQAWYPIAQREAAQMADGAVLLDLSPFTKTDVSGRRALEALNFCCTAQMDRKLGKATYAQFLNAEGGIEMDATVTRLGEDHFRVTSGAATRQRDLAYLRRNLPDVKIEDVTEEFCVIGVMGDGADKVMVTPQDVAFGQSGEVKLAGVSCRLTRISYVGEFGWEISVPAAHAVGVFDELREAGALPMGHYALDGCRLEKGFVHWGHDVGPEVTPLAARLGFTIDWSKDFIGKQALLKQRDEGVRKRLVLMQIEGDALMLHDEPIFEGDTHVGLTTSGALGPRTGLNLAFGIVSVSPGESRDGTCQRQFSVRVAGQDYRAEPLRYPPFDPKGERMRR
ncbi:MAG: FAD-dependent oxidoreductase [Pseudomonadota bacterium]